MLYQQEIEQVFTDYVKALEVEKRELIELAPRLDAAVEQVHAWKEENTLPLLRLPFRDDDMAEIEEVAAWFRDSFAHVLVVGTGGSSLGGQTLVALKDNPYLPAKKGAPKLWFLDNVDPHTMEQMLASINLKETGVLVISKSGGTAEIMAQTLILLARFRDELGRESIARHFVSITEPKPNALRQLSESYGIRVLDHDPAVGGRFSVISLVGLIPAAIVGVDVRAVREGARVVEEDFFAQKASSPVALGAAVNYILMQKGYGISVLMPYADKLAYFGMWYRQLWAESLGKDGLGTTPIRAMGTIDQHSQLQLYLDGPKDKFFTLVLPNASRKGPKIEAGLVTDEALAYIRNQHLGDVMAAHQFGTEKALAKKGIPTRILRVDAVNEQTMGALLMHYMLETMVTAQLMDVNAFDQPAVEDGKVFARAFLLEQQQDAA